MKIIRFFQLHGKRQKSSNFSNFKKKDKNDQIFPTSRKKTKIIKLLKNQRSKNQEILKYQKFARKTDEVKTKSKQNGTKTKINQD